MEHCLDRIVLVQLLHLKILQHLPNLCQLHEPSLMDAPLNQPVLHNLAQLYQALAQQTLLEHDVV